MSDAPSVSNPQSSHRYVIDRILPEGELSLLCGPSRVGKTILALQMLRDHHLDRPIFGCQPRGGYAVYVACDRSLHSLHSMMSHLDMDPHDYPCMSLLGTLSREDKSIELAVQEAAKLVEAVRWVILDGISALCRGRINEDADVSKFLGSGISYARQTNIAVLGVIRASKSREGEGYSSITDRALGSGAWPCMSEVFYSLDYRRPKDSTDNTRLLTILPRNGRAIRESLAFDDSGLRSMLEATSMDNLDAWFDTLVDGTILVTKHIIEVAATKYCLSRATAFRWITSQVELGRLVELKHGHYSVVHDFDDETESPATSSTKSQSDTVSPVDSAATSDDISAPANVARAARSRKVN